jgi:hypothetical protein
MQKKSVEPISLKRLIELVHEDFGEGWHLPRSRLFYLFVSMSGAALSTPFIFLFLLLPYVTEKQLGVAILSAGIALLAITSSSLSIFVSSGTLDQILKEDRFRRICRSEKFRPVDTARNKLLAWALISIRERIPMRLDEAMKGAQTLFQDETLLHDAILRAAP